MRDGLEADLSNFSLGQPESRGKAHAHRMNLLVPRLVSFKLQTKRRTDRQLRSLHSQKKVKEKEETGKQSATSDRHFRASHASPGLVLTQLVMTELAVIGGEMKTK